MFPDLHMKLIVKKMLCNTTHYGLYELHMVLEDSSYIHWARASKMLCP